MDVSCLLLLSIGLVPWAWGLSSLPPVADPGPCVPPLNASAPVGPRGYGRFHANDSLLGRPLPCTREDKICFRHNLIFDPKHKLCKPIGDGSEYYCDLRPNRTEFEHGSGRIVGICKEYEDPCPGYRMSLNGRCYRKEVVRDVICGCEAKPTRHFLDGVECRSSSATPISIQQPEEEGRCLIPDLRFPDTERSEFFKNPWSDIQGFEGTKSSILPKPLTRLKCDSNQSACFSQDKVWISLYMGCHTLLQRGPCPEDHVVAMNVQAVTQGRAEATCVHVRGGCPPGHKRMEFDGQCHDDWEIQIEAPGRIDQNQFGQYVLIPYTFHITFHPRKGIDYCYIGLDFIGGLPHGAPKPPCGSEQCDLYEVENEAPKPEE